MPIIRRKSASGAVPVQQAQLIDSNAFRLSTASAEALKVIGGVVTELGERKLKAQDSLSTAEIGKSEQFSEAEMVDFMQANPDPSKWDEQAEKIIARHGQNVTSKEMSKSLRDLHNVRSEAWADNFRFQNQLAQTKKIIADDVRFTGSTYISNPTPENRDAAEQALLRKEQPKIVEVEMKLLDQQADEQTLSTLMQQASDPALTKEESDALFAEARRLLPKTALDADQKVATAKFIESEQARVQRKTEDISFARKMEVNRDFVDRVFTQDLSPTEVAESNLDDKGGFKELSKKQWQTYVDGASDPEPTESQPESYINLTDTVLDFIAEKNQVTEESAYRSILDLRYRDQEITDTDFAWAIEHIKNPYPKPVATDIRTALLNNNTRLRGTGLFDKLRFNKKEQAQARDVNTDLVNWVDTEIADGRTPTLQQMNERSAQIIAGEFVPVEPKEDLSGLSTEELIKRITGGD